MALLSSSTPASRRDKRLMRKWARSELWPAVQQEETAIFSVDGRPVSYSKFCPEAAGETFGVFAEYLGRYADELDSDRAHQLLANAGATSRDWRWAWAGAVPRHFTECRLFSLLAAQPSERGIDEDVINIKPGMFGISLNLRALWRRLRRTSSK